MAVRPRPRSNHESDDRLPGATMGFIDHLEELRTRIIRSLIAIGVGMAMEEKFAVPCVILTTLGTIAGAAFSHYVLYPSMMGFFATFSTPRMRADALA